MLFFPNRRLISLQEQAAKSATINKAVRQDVAGIKALRQEFLKTYALKKQALETEKNSLLGAEAELANARLSLKANQAIKTTNIEHLSQVTDETLRLKAKIRQLEAQVNIEKRKEVEDKIKTLETKTPGVLEHLNKNGLRTIERLSSRLKIFDKNQEIEQSMSRGEQTYYANYAAATKTNFGFFKSFIPGTKAFKARKEFATHIDDQIKDHEKLRRIAKKYQRVLPEITKLRNGYTHLSKDILALDQKHTLEQLRVFVSSR